MTMKASQDTQESSPVDIHKRWALELEEADKETKEWVERSKKIVKRYRDERNRADGGQHPAAAQRPRGASSEHHSTFPGPEIWGRLDCQ